MDWTPPPSCYELMDERYFPIAPVTEHVKICILGCGGGGYRPLITNFFLF